MERRLIDISMTLLSDMETHPNTPHESATLSPHFTAEEAQRWTAGQWEGAPPVQGFAGVCTHSLEVRRGALFVALKGERFDAHQFVPQALDAGAAGALVLGAPENNASARNAGAPGTVTDRPGLLCVADTRKALMDLAAGYRLAVGAKIIGVTGSVGKTTVKEMAAALLATLGRTTKTQGNLNNDVGLPLSLLSMPRDAQFGVFEAGISHPGEMMPLACAMRPDVAIVTNVGPVHLEHFGEVGRIAEEKAGLLRVLAPDGIAVLDRDAEWFGYLAGQTRARVVSISATGDARADIVAHEVDEAEGAFVVRDASGGEARIRLGLPGRHHVANALLAIAAARHLGVGWGRMCDALRGVVRPPMRWEVSEREGVAIINDAYNANPVSMAKALETFAKMPCRGRRIAALGDMLELGTEEEAAHCGIGALAATCGLDLVVLVGSRATRWIAAGAAGRMQKGHVHCFATPEEAGRFLRTFLRPGDALLLKGSRGMAMEKVF